MDDANEGHLLDLLAGIENHLRHMEDNQEALIKLKLMELLLTHGEKAVEAAKRKVDW